MRINEVRAIVTGAASGLGRHFTLKLASLGASVAAGDIDVQGLDELKQECETFQGKVMTGRLDVSQEASVVEFVNKVSHQLGGVNTLVNNAGILRDCLLVKEEEVGWIKKLPTKQWQQVLEVNLTGAYFVTREVVADVIQRNLKESIIVNISSMSRAGNPGQSNYAASKSGLDACTRTWALELASRGVRVGGIAPGLIETPILRHVSDEVKQNLLANIPLKRAGTVDEVWLALQFIIECDYFTGRTIEVDGGSAF
jgi:3-oxoacyl-[acyl-carrier protein] reductase